jgi:DNA-binding response OmpR family regulator
MLYNSTDENSILVVDDTPDRLHFLASILSQQECDVCTVIGGLMALTLNMGIACRATATSL